MEQDSGSEELKPMSRKDQLWFSEIASQSEAVFVQTFREVTPQVDLVEVCAPWDSPLSQSVIDHGGKAVRIGIHNGYDLSTKAGCAKAIRLVRELRPRYVHVSPACDPWTSVNNANQRNPHQIENLQQKRSYSRRILRSCQKVVELQRCELQGDAGGEHPLRAQSWGEPTFKRMVQLWGGRFRCDGCQFGLKHPKTERPLQKPWGWFSSVPEIKTALHKMCTHEAWEHEKIEGDVTSMTAIYPSKLCAVFTKALMSTKAQIRKIMFSKSHLGAAPAILAAENEEVSGQEEPGVDVASGDERQEATWGRDKIMNKLRVIHSNLGHPSKTVLYRMLKEARASQEILEAVNNFECDFCRQRGHANPHKTSAVTRAKDKWEVLSVDTFWWISPHKNDERHAKEKILGISFLDEMTDLHVASLVRVGGKNVGSISHKDFVKRFSQDWLKLLPKPKIIRFDEEGAFRDSSLMEWLGAQSIEVQFAAGEAAWQVGKHSRHLEVLKETMSLLGLELGPEVDAEVLLDLSLSAKNSLHQLHGYTPNQWALGQEKDSVGSWLQHGNCFPVQSLRKENLTFEENLNRIQKAKETFLQADARRRLLRAARGQSRKSENFEIGQLVYFYRKGRNATSKQIAGWYGPGRVVGIEKHGSSEENQTQGSIVWVSYGTTLYRHAPEQLRKVTNHFSRSPKR